MDQVERGIYRYYTYDGHLLSYFPSLVGMSYRDRAIVQVYLVSAPATYDLWTTGKLSPNKNPGACGSCWALLPMDRWNSGYNLVNPGTFWNSI